MNDRYTRFTPQFARGGGSVSRRESDIVLWPSISTRYKRMRRDTRGTTMVEYGIMLFLVLVVCAVGLKLLGISLQHKFGQANNSVAGQTESAGASQQANYGGKGVASAAPSAAPPPSDINKDPTDTTAAGGKETASSGLPMIARFALLALGVIGTAAAFFAMKNKKT